MQNVGCQETKKYVKIVVHSKLKYFMTEIIVIIWNGS